MAWKLLETHFHCSECDIKTVTMDECDNVFNGENIKICQKCKKPMKIVKRIESQIFD